jgi:hypothetical protein
MPFVAAASEVQIHSETEEGCQFTSKLGWSFRVPDALLTDVSGASHETEERSWRHPVLGDQDRLHALEYRHGVHLVAPDDVDDHHHVGRGDEPGGLLQRHEDVVTDVAPERPVPGERDGEVAQRGDHVARDGAPPHGHLGRLGGRGRDRGLDLQHHAVPRVRERHRPAQLLHRLVGGVCLARGPGGGVSYAYRAGTPADSAFRVFGARGRRTRP